MAYEFLKKLFKVKEGEEPKSMTYEELETAITAANLNIADLSTGEYVAKGKFDKKNTELTDTKALLDDANIEIQRYKDMDVEGIKKSVDDWETKYNTDTKALQDKLNAQERSHAADTFMSGYQFTSEYAKRAIMAAFLEQNMPLQEDGTFLGAKDFMDSLKEKDPGSFVIEEPASNPDPATPPAPAFTSGKPATPPASGKKMTLSEMMKYANEHPETDVATLIENNK